MDVHEQANVPLDLTLEVIRGVANWGALTAIFAVAQARGLVGPSDWHDVAATYGDDPDGARRALLPD